MAKYIDAEKLKLQLRRYLMPNVDDDGTVTEANATRYFLNLIDEMSTEDVVEVVRCKNCIHKINYKGIPMCTVYGEEVSGAWYGLNVTKDEHFCSYGEKKQKNNFKE